MAKRSNNSLSRRSYGGKPYDANNSFVKKMATRVTDLIPQRSWISKWFNASQDNGDVSNEAGNSEEIDTEEEEVSQQPPAKRPRIRMDVTHPPGTFSIRGREKESSNSNDSRGDAQFLQENESEEYFVEPVAGPSGVCKFVSSTPAVHAETGKSNVPSVQQQNRQPIGSLIAMENNGASNGADDNSESGESTSGCSSLIPQTNRQEGSGNSAYGSSLTGARRFMNDKSSFANNLQSPRCLFLENGNRESFNSRRPSFNASMITNNNSNITLDRASSLSSPFYSGNVTFGGSNALGHIKRSRSLFNSNNEFQLKIPRRTSVQVKPSNTECIMDASGMSQTAKRILEAMEYFSSPIADAKKIPLKNDSTTGKKRTRDEQQQQVGLTGSPLLLPTARVGLRHLTRELAVPTVPDMLKLRRRKKLQDTTVAARKIISAMSSGGVGLGVVGPPMITSAQTRASEDYHFRAELDQSPKYHGKLRGKSKKNPHEKGPVPRVNLPSISLPITSLPSFEPLPKYTIPACHENDRRGFKFASPIKITEAAWNLKSINNFSFSKPINARVDEADSTKILGTNVSSDIAATNFIWSGSSTAPRLKVKTKKPKENSDNVYNATGLLFGTPAMKEMAKLKSENVADVQVSESPSKKVAFGDRTLNFEIWECTECYIKNDSKENVCVACKATKPRKTTMDDEISSRLSVPTANNVNETTSFGSQFKMNVNQWECESCLVRNKQTSLRCVSCSSPKPVKMAVPPVSESRVSTSKIPKAKSSDLMDKFKPPEGSWECPGCMLRNPSAVITCPCCNAAKPSLRNISPKKTNTDKNANDGTSEKTTENSSIMDKFKPATSSWECSSCMVRNNESASYCVCCSNPKPGTASISSESAKPATSASGWADKFKQPEGSWSCDSCMVQNKAEVTECIACKALKPGATPKPRSAATSNFSFGIPATQNAPTFNFGIDKAGEKLNTDTSLVSTNGFSFGGKNPQIDADSSQFTFGMPKKTAEKSEIASKVSMNPTGFVFAPPKNPKQANESEKVGSTVVHSENKIESFSFGQSNAMDEKKTLGQKSASFGEDAVASAGVKSAKTPFVFGTPKSEDNCAETSKSKISLGEATSESAKPSVFGGQVTQTTSGNLANPINQGVGLEKSIGASVEAEKETSSNLGQARSPFTFSEPKSKLTSSSMPPSFGSTPVTAVTPSTFPMPETENKSSAAPNFGVGSSAFGGSFVPSSSQSPIIGEASAVDAKQQTTCPAFPSAENKSTIFGMPGETKQQPLFGATVEKKSLFGNPDKSTAVFGTSDKAITTSNSNSIFNAPISTPAPSSGFPGASSSGTSQPVFGSSTTPVFGGSNNTSSFPTGSMNIFAVGGKSSVPSTPTSNLFTFGGASAQQIATPAIQSAPGGFSFATTDNVAESSSSVAEPIFAFGSGTGSQQSECFGGAGSSTGAGVAFGTPAPTNSVSSPFGSFNVSSSKQDSPAPPPTFGQATAAAPAIPSIFGAQQPISASIGQQPTTGGFNFGATVPVPIAGGFNFGGGMAQQPATGTSGGFNFNAATPSPSIAFDPNTRPSFNFTGGSAPTAFNATPQPATTRKIKKAVRRMQQR